MIDLIETCSVWKNNNKYRLCHTEYAVIFVIVIGYDSPNLFRYSDKYGGPIFVINALIFIISWEW
jgi:uncharacterized protein YvpB